VNHDDGDPTGLGFYSSSRSVAAIMHSR
jgi:hypothetical protein